MCSARSVSPASTRATCMASSALRFNTALLAIATTYSTLGSASRNASSSGFAKPPSRRTRMRTLRGIVGRIKIDGDQPCAMVQPLRMTFDHALGQRCAHVIKLARANGIFKARQRRLRSHIQTRNWIAVEQHLVHRIGGQSGRVVGVRITTADGEYALREKIPQPMVNLARLPRIA